MNTYHERHFNNSLFESMTRRKSLHRLYLWFRYVSRLPISLALLVASIGLFFSLDDPSAFIEKKDLNNQNARAYRIVNPTMSKEMMLSH